MDKFKKIFLSFYLVFWVATIAIVFAIWNEIPQILPVQQEETYSHEFIHGEVRELKSPSNKDEAQLLIIRADSGEEKGEAVIAPVSSANNFNQYEIGDEVQIYKMINNLTAEITYEVSDYYHGNGLIWIFIIFAVITVLIARKKGLTAILSVAVSLILFYFVFLKMVIAGHFPVYSCLIFVIMATFITIPLIHGFNKKSLSAIIAIFFGYALSIFISFLFKDVAQLGNSPGEEFRMLGVMYPAISLSDILVASIFIGAVGALIDTTISIASAVFEAIGKKTEHTFLHVYKIGMAVGKDVLGSMINTLLFAYLASALPFLVIVTLSHGSALVELINIDFIALELTRTFIGAISLVVIIPITASISAYLLIHEKVPRISRN